MAKSGRLRPGLHQAEVLAVIWALGGTDVYLMLVLDRGWTPPRYEEWLGSTLINLLLSPIAPDSNQDPGPSRKRQTESGRLNTTRRWS
jgi:hypothetical protein